MPFKWMADVVEPGIVQAVLEDSSDGMKDNTGDLSENKGKGDDSSPFCVDCLSATQMILSNDFCSRPFIELSL